MRIVHTRIGEPSSPERLASHPLAMEAYQVALNHQEALHEDPTSEDLRRYWEDFYQADTLDVVPGVLGVVRRLNSNERPTTIVSLDICEVVRETCFDLAKISSNPNPDRTANGYAYGTELGITRKNDKEYPNEKLILRLVQGRMVRDLVGPEAGIEEMHDILQDMRNNGAFVIANTSTLPGCEPSTMRFFKKHLENGVDGILLPRNHDGSGEVTKGNSFSFALSFLSDTYRLPIRSTLAVDDSPHHIHAIRKEVQNFHHTSHFDVTPKEPINKNDPDLRHLDSPLLAMQALQEVHNLRRNL